MIRLKAGILSLIRRIDPDTAHRISRGWGWHVVAFLALVYVGLGIHIRESIDSLVLFFGVSSVAVSLGYQAENSFLHRPRGLPDDHPISVIYDLYRVILMAAFVLSVGHFF